MDANAPKTRCGYPWQQMVIDLTGEVVPCCFYSAYGGSTAKPFGNTNRMSLAEIWNGPGYQDLRRRHAEGDLENHPCNRCLAYYWNNEDYPGYQWFSGARPETGHCHVAAISEKFLAAVGGREDEVRLFEDGVELGPARALHDDIRTLGQGRYSVWMGSLYFSTSDGSDPAANGRRYELRWQDRTWSIARLVPDTPSARNLQAGYREYRSGDTRMTAKPTMLTWSSTADCNIDCGYCSQNQYRAAKLQHRPETEAAVLALVPELVYFSWAGGEPYFLKNYRKFVDEHRLEDNPNLTFGFTTNGTRFSAEELAKLDRFPRISASFSIDSFEAANFERLRRGASFGRVMANFLRALATSDAPDRSFVCGQLVMKSNVLELPLNIRFAMEADIGLNLSPVTLYPLDERLDVFTDFAAQTRGWREALEEALRIATDARARGALAIRRVDVVAGLGAVGRILDRAERRYATTERIEFDIRDPHGALARMARPAIVVTADSGFEQAMSYVGLSNGPGRYACFVPRAEVAASAVIRWDLLADLREEWIRHLSGLVQDGTGAAWGGSKAGGSLPPPRPVVIDLPAFAPPVRDRNAKVANFGLPRSDGLSPASEAEMWDALRRIEAVERYQSMPLSARDRLLATVKGSPTVRRAYRLAKRALGIAAP